MHNEAYKCSPIFSLSDSWDQCIQIVARVQGKTMDNVPLSSVKPGICILLIDQIFSSNLKQSKKFAGKSHFLHQSHSTLLKWYASCSLRRLFNIFHICMHKHWPGGIFSRPSWCDIRSVFASLYDCIIVLYAAHDCIIRLVIMTILQIDGLNLN